MENSEEKYKEFSLPASADDYLRSVLNYSKKMPELIRQNKDTKKTVKTTWLPVETEEKVIEERYQGGAIATHEITLQWLVQKIKEFLSSGDDRIVVFEHGAARKNDPWIERAKPIYFSYYKDEVYLSLFARNSSNEGLIEDTIRHAEVAWRLLGIMTSLPAKYLPLPHELTDEVFKLLVQNAEHIFVSAFDGEGYIIYTFEGADHFEQ